MSIHGSCYCKKIRFEVVGELRGIIYCHCAQCRKISGHYLAASAAKNDELTVTGEVTWFRSSDMAERGFCGDCGTHMFWRADGENYTSIEAGAFDEETKLYGEKHIYVESKGAYYEINDGLPQYHGYEERVK